MQPLRCINYFQITHDDPHPFEHRHEEDYGKCRRKCTSPFSSCSNTQKHFRLFLQNIFIFFHSCMIHFNSFLSCSKENISIDNVCTFCQVYVAADWWMWGDVWILDSDWFRYNVNWSYLKSNRLFIFSPFYFTFCNVFFSMSLSWKAVMF